MRIALIGPGIMPIPPKDWGAVEILIWNYKVYLEKLGHHVDIFNTKYLQSAADAINSTPYDFIHLQYDEFIGFFNRALKKPYCVSSHYGYIKDLTFSNPYRKIYKDTLQAPGIIALSEAVAKKYRQSGYKGFLKVLRNGVEFDKFSFKPQGNGKAICVGKLDAEDRKCQIMLANLLKERIQIDFVGPIAGSAFKENETCRHLGVWEKDYLYEHLTEYSCLVLISKGEVAPLVVPEALAAGLGVVVSETASANLDAKAFISIVPDGCKDTVFLESTIREQILRNNKYREEIHEYARNKFDWNIIMRDYLDIIKEFNSQPRHICRVPFRRYRGDIIQKAHKKAVSLINRAKYLLNESLQIARREISVLFYYMTSKRGQGEDLRDIAIIFIGTGKYIDYFPKYYKTSKRLFLPKTKKTYFVFTDNIDYPYLKDKNDAVPVCIDRMKWPFPTLFRFRYINKISQQLERYSHVIFMDADMYVYSLISEKDFFSHNQPLFGAQHPTFFLENKKGNFEFNSASLACVSENDDLSIYWQGCFWGGRTNEVLELSKELARRVDDDLSRSVIAVWHDESHLNKYFIQHRDKVYTYHPGYIYPVVYWGRLPCERKIVHLLKDHDKIRRI